MSAEIVEAVKALGREKGISEEKLITALEDALAEIATANGKTAAGLVDALVAVAKADLDEKVESGRLTEAQRTSILADLESRMEDVVAGEFSFGFRSGPGGPPPGLSPSVAPSGTDA